MADSPEKKVEKLAGQGINSIPEARENTRSQLARLFILGYFITICAAAIFPAVYNALIASSKELPPIDIKEFVTVIAGFIGTPLGFVIAHYFQTADKE
jgi:hypothetical protein